MSPCTESKIVLKPTVHYNFEKTLRYSCDQNIVFLDVH